MSRKKSLIQMLAACEKAEFDRIVRVYLQEVYGYRRITQTDGKDDCGIDIKVFDLEGQKMQYQMTIQKSSTAQEKSKLKEKIFEDVAKAKVNFEEYGLGNNLLFFYSWELTNKIQREYKKEALTKFGINLDIVDANQIADESEEYLNLQQAIYDTSGLADFKLKQSLYDDENNNLIYDLVSFGKTSDIKLEIVEAYILRCLDIKGRLTLNDISELCNAKFSTNDNLSFYSKLINKLHSKDKKVNYIKNLKSYELTPEAQKEISRQTEQIKIDEKQFLNLIGTVLSSFHQENKIDDYITLLKDIYIDSFSKTIEYRNDTEKEKEEKEHPLFNKLMLFVRSNISNEDNPNELVRQLISVCDNNKYLQKLCASNIFCKKINIDNLQKYAHEKKQVYIDTTIALHILCYFYKTSNYNNYNYVLSKSLHEYCKKNNIRLYLPNRYLWEIGTHIQEAINLIPFTKLPGFSSLGKSRNVFYNHYYYLKETELISNSFEAYLREFGFTSSGDNKTNNNRVEFYLNQLGITIIEIPKYDIQNEVKIIGNKLSETRRFKTTFALNNDAIMLNYLGDPNVEIHPMGSVFVTWDKTLFAVLNEFYKKNPNAARWMQFTPSQFIDRYSLLSFSINEETISKDLLALISGDIVQHTVSLIDSLALILNPDDEIGLEYTKRFVEMKDSMIYTTNKIPDGEVDSTDNNALDNVVFQIISHYRYSIEYEGFKCLFKSRDYLNDVMMIMEESIKYYLDNKNLGYETFSKFDDLINTAK